MDATLMILFELVDGLNIDQLQKLHAYVAAVLKLNSDVKNVLDATANYDVD